MHLENDGFGSKLWCVHKNGALSGTVGWQAALCWGLQFGVIIVLPDAASNVQPTDRATALNG